MSRAIVVADVTVCMALHLNHVLSLSAEHTRIVFLRHKFIDVFYGVYIVLKVTPRMAIDRSLVMLRLV